MNRPGTHPIAWTRSAVDFGPGDPLTGRAMAKSLRTQRKRSNDWHKARKSTPANARLGLWLLPHAVALTDPFVTACGLIYNYGVEVNGVLDQHGTLTETFEALTIQIKCRGCAGAIGAHPGV